MGIRNYCFWNSLDGVRTMKTWKYTDATNRVVVSSDGLESCLASVLPEGTVIEPANPIPPQPIIVSPRQIRQALTASGLRASVEAAVAAGDQDVKDWWEFATTFESNHPMVVGMATGLGVTEQQLTNLFNLAKSL